MKFICKCNYERKSKTNPLLSQLWQKYEALFVCKYENIQLQSTHKCVTLFDIINHKPMSERSHQEQLSTEMLNNKA